MAPVIPSDVDVHMIVHYTRDLHIMESLAVVPRAVNLTAAHVHIQNWITAHPWIYGVIAGGGIIVIAGLILLIVCCCWCCIKRRRGKSKSKSEDSEEGMKLSDMSSISGKHAKGKHRSKQQVKEETAESTAPEPASGSEPEVQEDQDEYTTAMHYFLSKHSEYTITGTPKPLDLGSRMQKYWYKIQLTSDSNQERLITVAPVSLNCPLELHKFQKGINKVLQAVKMHPYLHPIEYLEYLVDHQLLVMVQPLIHSGSLKDMIYKTLPLTEWSQKYAHRSKPLATEKISRYGRHILEGLKFLYKKGFPMLGHVQTGNIFVVDDVCHLGGYENTLLGYRTRLFRLCKDNLEHFDVILFGHVVFEMAAGYELTRLRPGEAEYKTVDKKVRPVLEYIFEEGFPHDLQQISAHDFFGASLPELSDFDPAQVKLSDSEVLEKVRKGKPRVQKTAKSVKTRADSGVSQFVSGIKKKLPKLSSASKLIKEEREMKPLLEGKST